MDAALWHRIAGARLVQVDTRDERATLTVQLPEHLASAAPGGRLQVALDGVSVLFYLGYDASPSDPELVEPAAIAAAAPVFERARVADDGRDVLLHGPRGFVRLGYRSADLSVEQEAFDRVVLAAWDHWRGRFSAVGQHPALVEAVHGPWTPDLLDRLRAAWAEARTTALADLITLVDEAIGAPAEPLATPEAIRAWLPTPLSEARVRELGRAAEATWDLLAMDRRDGGGRAEAVWAALTAAVGRLRSHPPDPRIGRGLETTSAAPSDHIFRPDEVDHVVAAPRGSAEERFADHLFPLLLDHGDAGSAGRLAGRAADVRVDADCYGVELSRRLDETATWLRARYPRDTSLPWMLAAALRNRGPVPGAPGADPP